MNYQDFISCVTEFMQEHISDSATIQLKEIQKNEHCCKARYLDFVNKKGTHKVYYNSNFVTEFLKRYNDTV